MSSTLFLQPLMIVFFGSKETNFQCGIFVYFPIGHHACWYKTLIMVCGCHLWIPCMKRTCSIPVIMALQCRFSLQGQSPSIIKLVCVSLHLLWYGIYILLSFVHVTRYMCPCSPYATKLLCTKDLKLQINVVKSYQVAMLSV